ncbi:hypothetical protein [Rhodococcus opacus]|uniref:hypothetical protein n=1 Tax=Rhodococcus opacus TaxID=37919 RepID=UPI00223605AB|nr:hypothetical protein [Rhodococcus opacus]UZG60023.1 hypothetical protein ONE62_40610 [Rhodococcus opacus]
MLLLAIHAVIALAGPLAPNRSAAFIRHLARQIALARIQQRWITVSGTGFSADSQGQHMVHQREYPQPHHALPRTEGLR